MRHSEAQKIAKAIVGPAGFVLLSASAGALRYRVCVRTGAGMKVFSQGDSWESALQAAAQTMDEVMQAERERAKQKEGDAP